MKAKSKNLNKVPMKKGKPKATARLKKNKSRVGRGYNKAK